MKPLKVLMLPKWYPHPGDLAEGNYIYRHIKAVGACTEATVLFIHSQKQKKLYLVSEEDDHPVTAIRVYFKKSSTGFPIFDKPANFFRYFRAQQKGYRFYRQKHRSPDVVHVHSFTRTCGLALYLKFTLKIPFIISEHWSGFLPERSRGIGFFKGIFIRFFSGRANAITVVSQKLKAGVISVGATAPVYIIPNVFNSETFFPAPAPLLQSIDFVHISRLDDHTKNFGGILRAFAKVAEKNKEIRLHVFGDGIEKQKQEKLAASLGISEKIIFYGYCDQEIIAEQLRKSAALIVFSHYESQSCAIIESFACGIPVIATKVGGIPEFVNEERGILINDNDEESLCNAIEKIAGKSIHFDRKKIAGYALEHFCNEKTGRMFEQLYRDLKLKK